MTTPDPNYLKNEQYSDSTRLQARARLHADYSTNPYNWFEWMFDLYDLPADAKVLEIGAGAGWLWMRNAGPIPKGWDITLSDFSSGMVAEQRKNLSESSHPFKFEEIDIQAIPYADHTFDAVIANHMLYHVPDRVKAIAEVRRVLKPIGKLYTATNGDHHLQELHQLMTQLEIDRSDYLGGFAAIRGYTLENAGEQLQTAFEHVELYHYEDAIRLTNAQPLVDYILSFPIQLTPERQLFIAEVIQAHIQEHGTFNITKDMGVLLAY